MRVGAISGFLSGNAAGRIWIRLVRDDIRQRHPLRVLPEEVRIVIVGVGLIEVAVEKVEALIIRPAFVRAAGRAETPLAAQRR